MLTMTAKKQGKGQNQSIRSQTQNRMEWQGRVVRKYLQLRNSVVIIHTMTLD